LTRYTTVPQRGRVGQVQAGRTMALVYGRASR